MARSEPSTMTGNTMEDVVTCPYETKRRSMLRGLGTLQRDTFVMENCNYTASYRLSWSNLLWAILAALVLVAQPVDAVLISKFDNCLAQSYQSANPQPLQFVPTFVDAVFDTVNTSHNLRVTVWGNVTGEAYAVPLPPPSDSSWSDPKVTDGKIVNVTAETNKLTTLYSKVDFLTYEPYASNQIFCNQLVQGACPLAPVFNASANMPSQFPAFSINNNFAAGYAFTSLTATLTIINGDAGKTSIGCVSASITPDLGRNTSGLLMYLPLAVLVFVAAATAFAGMWSHWGTTDIFRWTSNYGRDPDQLRLVTPGFGDCLQYIQFIALTGGLTLNYPGYYQPVASKVAWSALMFNQSFVTHGTGYKSLVDGIYVTNGTYGLEDLSQLIGMTDAVDVWANMCVWLLVVLGVVMTVVQLGFLFRWLYRRISNTPEEDLRAKNMPFSVGNIIRIVFSYFLLPIVSLSMFQLVITIRSPVYLTALAVVMLVAVVVFAAWLLYVIASTRPRSFLFDDLPTVLTYGPLYNTYSDNAATFALIPAFLIFVRGIAIGALQPSGIAQLVLLAICEVVTILTLHAFRPFHSPTSMNAYHTFFAICRLASVLLLIAFAPSLGVTDGAKGWIGYAILLLHGIVLIFAFFLNALQTILEVAARLAGAGGDESGGARGGLVKVFGMRQLSRRLPRGGAGSRQSQLSTSNMLDPDHKGADGMVNMRHRSHSIGSTGVLLNRPQSVGLDSIPPHGAGSYTPTTPGEASMFSFLPSAPGPAPKSRGTILNLSTTEPADPFYRPPRTKRATMDPTLSPGAGSRASWISGDWTTKRWSQTDTDTQTHFGPSGRATPLPAYMASPPASGDSPSDNRLSQTDYTTREVDFYYGVRGPALNANVPGRRLRTGPVDPTNNIATIGGFFKGFFGGKTKEKGKGFEVVRSSRMPPGMKARNVAGDESPPEGIPVAAGVVRNGPIDSDDDEPRNTPRTPRAALPQDSILDRSVGDFSPSVDGDGDEDEFEMTRISDVPPSLPGLDTGGGLNIPSRLPSKASSNGGNGLYSTPSLPRKSPRRTSQRLHPNDIEAGRVEEELDSPILERRGLYDPIRTHQPQRSRDSSRLPFDRSGSNRRHSAVSTKSSVMASPIEERQEIPTTFGHVHKNSVRTINFHDRRSVDLFGSSAEIVTDGEDVV